MNMNQTSRNLMTDLAFDKGNAKTTVTAVLLALKTRSTTTNTTTTTSSSSSNVAENNSGARSRVDAKTNEVKRDVLARIQYYENEKFEGLFNKTRQQYALSLNILEGKDENGVDRFYSKNLFCATMSVIKLKNKDLATESFYFGGTMVNRNLFMFPIPFRSNNEMLAKAVNRWRFNEFFDQFYTLQSWLNGNYLSHDIFYRILEFAQDDVYPSGSFIPKEINTEIFKLEGEDEKTADSASIMMMTYKETGNADVFASRIKKLLPKYSLLLDKMKLAPRYVGFIVHVSNARYTFCVYDVTMQQVLCFDSKPASQAVHYENLIDEFVVIVRMLMSLPLNAQYRVVTVDGVPKEGYLYGIANTESHNSIIFAHLFAMNFLRAMEIYGQNPSLFDNNSEYLVKEVVAKVGGESPHSPAILVPEATLDISADGMIFNLNHMMNNDKVIYPQMVRQMLKIGFDIIKQDAL